MVKYPSAAKELLDSESINQIWEQNRLFFMEHEELYAQQFSNKYVAVHEGKVIGTGEKLGELAGEIYETLGNIPFYADIPNNQEIELLNLPLLFPE